jgi:hypothetical protein
MFHRRWIGLVVVALILIGIFSSISGAAQRDAWMQGYMAGRLSTSSDGGAALAPYMMQGGMFGPHYGGFGSGFGIFIGLAFLALGIFLVSRGRRWARSGGGQDDWHEHFRREARRWHEGHRSPWDEQRPGVGGPGDEQRMV